MAINCNSCKWQRIRNAGGKSLKNLGLTEKDLNAKCATCLEEFKARCAKNPPLCFSCEWKDRNLPYEARELRCKACVEAFVAKSYHDCLNCPWNNPKRKMPTDATLAHCKACIGICDKTEGAMNCETCDWYRMPEETRRKHCLGCSVMFASKSKVRLSTNELSNKGQTIISYDNHNPCMEDDRDNVSNLASDYTEASDTVDKGNAFFDDDEPEDAVVEGQPQGEQVDIRKKKDEHPVVFLARKYGFGGEDCGEFVYEMMKRFLCELGQLTDLQALLLLSELRGDKKTVFAQNHNITDSAVNILFKQILGRSVVFRDFIVLSRGSVAGTRGRKAKDGKSMVGIQRESKKKVFAGVFQQEMGI